MAKVQIKSEKPTPFGGIFPIMEQFDALLAQTINSTLGMRCKWYGYQYSEILRSLMYQLSSAKLLQKSEMRKDIVIELSYKGFS